MHNVDTYPSSETDDLGPAVIQPELPVQHPQVNMCYGRNI